MTSRVLIPDNLSPHFKRKEFACKCGCGLDTVDAELLELCEAVRDYVGVMVVVTSGHRCPAHNEIVRGAKNSQHLYGRAADLRVNDPKDVFDWLCFKYPNRYGFGLYRAWVHVDTRTGPGARWDGR